MKQLLYLLGVLIMMTALSACGKWEPKVSGTDSVTGSAASEEGERKKIRLELDCSSENQIVIPDPAKTHGDVVHIQLQEEDNSDEEDEKKVLKKYMTDLSFLGFSDEVVVTSYAVGHMTSKDSEKPDCLALHVHKHPELQYSDSEADLEKMADYFVVLDYGKGTYYKTRTDFIFHNLSRWTKLECRDMTGDGKQELVISHYYNRGYEVGVFRCDDRKRKMISLFSTMEGKEKMEDYPDRLLFSAHLEDDYKVDLEYPDIGYQKSISMIREGGYQEKDLQVDTEDPYGEVNFVGLWKDGKLKKKGSVYLYALYTIDFVTDKAGIPQLALMRPVVVEHRSCAIGYMHTFFQYDKETDALVLKDAEYVTAEEEEDWNYTDAAITE